MTAVRSTPGGNSAGSRWTAVFPCSPRWRSPRNGSRTGVSRSRSAYWAYRVRRRRRKKGSRRSWARSRAARIRPAGESVPRRQDIVGESPPFVPFQGGRGHAVRARPPQFFGQHVVVREQGASLPACDVLVREETEATDAAVQAQRLPPVRREARGAVLDHRDAAGVGHLQEFLHAASEPGVMDRDDRPRARPELGVHGIRVHGQVVLADGFAQPDVGSQRPRRVGAGHESEGGAEDVVARSDAQGLRTPGATRPYNSTRRSRAGRR